MFFRTLLERWLLLWLLLGCTLSFLWFQLFPAAADPFEASKPYFPYLIVAIMFSIGCVLPPDELKQVGRQWPTVAAGTTLQYLSMPLLAFLLGTAFSLGDTEFIGLMIIGCVPGAMASNLLTLMARGNVSYSISLTTLATILSPLAIPLGLYLTLQARAEVEAGKMILDLLGTVVLPLVAGFALCRLWPGFARVMTWLGPVIANLAVLWLIASVVGVNRTLIGQATLGIVGILSLLNLLGYLSGYVGGMALRFPEKMRRALTIEIGMQNAGLGTVLATRYFSADYPGCEIPGAIYTFGCMLTGTLLAHIWARMPPEKEPPKTEHYSTLIKFKFPGSTAEPWNQEY
jgi:BASS family bile acid:Na+ symporter